MISHGHVRKIFTRGIKSLVYRGSQFFTNTFSPLHVYEREYVSTIMQIIIIIYLAVIPNTSNNLLIRRIYKTHQFKRPSNYLFIHKGIYRTLRKFPFHAFKEPFLLPEPPELSCYLQPFLTTALLNSPTTRNQESQEIDESPYIPKLKGSTSSY